MDFEQAVAYLNNLQPLGIRLGLDRFGALLDALDHPERCCPAAHVAGTKGKGSVTAMMASILKQHGIRAGAYLSPYVYDIRERVLINGDPAPRPLFAQCLDRVAAAAEGLADGPDGPCTEFEVKTALAFEAFRRSEVEASVVEVGLGGRLDATNLLQPRVCVITTIDYDHCDVLGNTIAQIAGEKAGIIKPGTPVVTSPGRPTALRVIRRRARELGAPVVAVAPGTGDEAPSARRGWFGGVSPKVWITTPRRRYSGVEIGLLGEHQARNAACAAAASEILLEHLGRDVEPAALAEGLRATRLPGRMEIHGCDPTLVLDGAHNRVSALALARSVRALPFKRLVLVVGMSVGHDPAPFLAPLAGMASRVVATQAGWRRALAAEPIAAAARRFCADVRTVTPVEEAVRQALGDAGAGDLVLVTGSFYVVGEADPRKLGYSD
ncbi:MAG: bifunctional folylpolyglutamate synthase/dihydrofolate synthase [Armatimonadetes bacterium]|nr:bifunctional folylpolyglutamate synthase/dihydrofolate synthase [Armatimonadota bacterium]